MNLPEPDKPSGGKALPTWFSCIDVLAQQMEMLERARPQGLWGIAVDRDPEALLWQKCCIQIQWLFKGLHWLSTLAADEPAPRDASPRKVIPVDDPASEQEA